MRSCCLGDVVAALVDGELDHAARERAHRHLAHCARCRTEVDGQRRLKARLSRVEPLEPPAALTERLLRIAAPAAGPVPVPAPALSAPREVRPPSRPTVGTPGSRRPARGRRGSTRPGTVRPHRAARRRAAASSAVALLGVAAALALGAPQPRPATTPVDPATDAFVTEFVSTGAGGGDPQVLPLPSARPAGLTTFVPLTRSALLTTGGARTTR